MDEFSPTSIANREYAYVDDYLDDPYSEYGECLADDVVVDVGIANGEIPGAEISGTTFVAATYPTEAGAATPWSLSAFYRPLLNTFWKHDALGLRSVARSTARALLGETTATSLENNLDWALNNPVEALVAGAETLWPESSNEVTSGLSAMDSGLAGAWTFFAGEEAPSLGEYYARTTARESLFAPAESDDFFRLDSAPSLFPATFFSPRETDTALSPEEPSLIREAPRRVSNSTPESKLHVFMPRRSFAYSAMPYAALQPQRPFIPTGETTAIPMTVASPRGNEEEPRPAASRIADAGLELKSDSGESDVEPTAETASPTPSAVTTLVAVVRYAEAEPLKPSREIPPADSVRAPENLAPPLEPPVVSGQSGFDVSRRSQAIGDFAAIESGVTSELLLRQGGESYSIPPDVADVLRWVPREYGLSLSRENGVATPVSGQAIPLAERMIALVADDDSVSAKFVSGNRSLGGADFAAGTLTGTLSASARDGERFIPAALFMIRQGAGNMRSESEAIRDRVELRATLARRLETVASADDLSSGRDGSRGQPDWSELLRENSASVKTSSCPKLLKTDSSRTIPKIQPVRVTDTVIV